MPKVCIWCENTIVTIENTVGTIKEMRGTGWASSKCEAPEWGIDGAPKMTSCSAPHCNAVWVGNFSQGLKKLSYRAGIHTFAPRSSTIASGTLPTISKLTQRTRCRPRVGSSGSLKMTDSILVIMR